MLAHCHVTYEMAYENNHPKPNALIRFSLLAFCQKHGGHRKTLQKKYAHSPAFLMRETKEFEKEKEQLIAYLKKNQKLGAAHFNGRESLSFGPLTKVNGTICFLNTSTIT